MMKGFWIYKIKESEATSKTKLNQQFFDNNSFTKRTQSWILSFAVTERFKLEPGWYVVIPSTWESNKEGDFFLRIFSEKPGVK